MEESRRLGAPLLTLQVYESRRPVLRRDVAEVVADPRFEPMRDLVLEAKWRSVIGVPLVARDAELGSLTTFYPASYDPDDDDISFLTAMAEQAAVAVENARLLAAVQDKAALEERHRLARDLHDSVSQALFSMNLQARALEMALEQAGGDPAGRVARGLAELRTLTQGALAEMRALIFQLRPEALHEEGLVAAVRKHAAAVTAREGVRIAVHAEADRLPLAEPTEAELFRVVQEAVHNSVKHGHPDQVDIWVNPDPDAPSTLVVEIGDDGVGFDPDVPHPGHLGLDSMRERTERLGGRLLIDSSDAGSRVRAVCPALLPPAAGVGQ
jgi:signal transduction histidine kinase